MAGERDTRPTALVAGATGLVGRHLVEELRNRRLPDGSPAYRSILLLVRSVSGMASPLEVPDAESQPGTVEGAASAGDDQVEAFSPESMGELGPGTLPPVRELVTRFSRLHQVSNVLTGDHVFCALGTTIKKAQSRNRFREIDHDHPVTVARLTRDNGARHFAVVSSMGADPGSRSFYLKTKGEMERSLRRVEFPGLTILRPSVIGGKRRDFRPGETLGRLLFSLLPGRLRTVHARDIARAMVTLALAEKPGVEVVESEEIRKLAGASG